MDCASFLDWLLNWKATLFLASGCFGVAVALFGLSFHRDLAELRKQTTRVADGIDALVGRGRKQR